MLGETITISESIKRLQNMSRYVNETITLQSFRGVSRTLSRIVSESIAISEAVNRLKAMNRVIAETININH